MRDSQTNPPGQVTELQRFLSDYYDLNPDDYVTGYFGRLTRDNVRKFQCERMNICKGDEATTGWGVVGPKTRATIRKACGAQTTTTGKTSPLQCINPPNPNLSCDGNWKKLFDKNRCHVGWTCIVTQSVMPETNEAPFIASIKGPTLLKPNVRGTWKITARDPENNTLAYSVIWGDEGRYVSQLLNIIQEGASYSAATTISHTYKKTGAYTIVVFARDSGGNIARATLSISVYEPVNQAVPSIKFGARVRATANLNVRPIPSLFGGILGQQAQGARGIVTAGPTIADGYTWWKINWDSGPDGWSVQNYLGRVATTNTNAPHIDSATVVRLASQALEKATQALAKANTALLDAHNSVTVANGLRILPGTLPIAVPALYPVIATAKNSAASAVKNAQRALGIAQTAHNEAMSAFQLANQGQTSAASAAAKKALSLSELSLRFSSVVERFVDVVNLIKRLLNSSVLW